MAENEQDSRGAGGGNSDAPVQADAGNGREQVSSDDRASENGGTEVVGTGKREEGAKAASSKLGPTTLTQDQMYDTLEKYVEAALKEEIIALNSLKIKKTYPKSYEKLVTYMNKKSSLEEMDEETIMGVFMYSPRTVTFIFFDNEKIFLNIFGSDQHWRYTMEANESSEESYKSRTLCEVAGYFAAFDKLEKQLTKK